MDKLTETLGKGIKSLQKLKSNNPLRDDYNDAVMSYVIAFEEKQGLEFDCWIGGQAGGTGWFEDMTLSFDDIRVDIDHEAEKGKIVEYYYYAIDAYQSNAVVMNYKNYLLIGEK